MGGRHDGRPLGFLSVGFIYFFTPRSPARLFESRSHLNPLPKRIVDLTCYVYYKIITQSLLTRCQQSVFFFFFLFFWLTHVISHRNIVYALFSRSPSFFHRVQIRIRSFSFSHFHSLPLSLSYSFSLSLALILSLSHILSFDRSPGFVPPLRSYRARENSKDAISASLKCHGGDNVSVSSSPFIFPLLSFFFCILPRRYH